MDSVKCLITMESNNKIEVIREQEIKDPVQVDCYHCSAEIYIERVQFTKMSLEIENHNKNSASGFIFFKYICFGCHQAYNFDNSFRF